MKNSPNLPRQIAALSVGAFLVSTVILWLAFYFIGQSMDQRAKDYSIQSVKTRILSLQEQVKIIAADYNNWDSVYIAAQEGRIDFLRESYGITAIRGEVFSYCLMFGGPFPEPISWTENGGDIPSRSFLPDPILKVIEENVESLDYSRRETFDSFWVLDENLVMLSASLLLPEFPNAEANNHQHEANAIIGKKLEQGKLTSISNELMIDQLKITFDSAPVDGVFLPLNGPDSKPVAFLSWNPPKPGSELVSKTAPVIASINFLFIIIGIVITRRVNRNAYGLIEGEAEASGLARTDSLTGIPNRRHLMEYVAEINGRQDQQHAAIAVDLDRFKQVNDLVGHKGGDAYICEFSRKLLAVVDDRTFIARLGGDEFAIILESQEDVAGLCERKIGQLKFAMKDGFKYNGYHFDMSASFGYAVRESLLITSELLPDMHETMRRADKAMYYAKSHRFQDACVYGLAMDAADKMAGAIEKALRTAINNPNEFKVLYQPIVSCSFPAKLVYSEALLRWKSPSLGSVGPDQFIPVAESTGIIVQLGWIVLDLVCQDLQANQDLSVSINLSPAQILSEGFAVEFSDRVMQRGINPSKIKIELTETIAVKDEDFVWKALNILRQFGFSMSLDDFGTGFSSIGYLQKMPFDAIKIDRSIMGNIFKGAYDFCIIRAIITLAHSMGKIVVAEGVETQEQLDRLRELGCDLVQGYLVDRPRPIFEIREKYLSVETEYMAIFPMVKGLHN